MKKEIMEKTESKKTLRLTLLMMDIIVLLSIFAGVIFLFEYVIKDILMRYSINKFYESMKTTQFDISNSMTYIDEKKDMPYEEYVNKVFDYVKLSALKRSKYDNSIFITIFPKEQNKIIVGKRNNINLKYNLKDADYNFFKDKIEELTQIRNQKNISRKVNHIVFDFQGREYIGIAEYSNSPVKKDFSRENKEIIYPILVNADRNDEFFFLINRVRNIFLFILLTVFGIGGYIKITNTIKATKEIQDISDSMSSITSE
jgi:hypothetical protein